MRKSIKSNKTGKPARSGWINPGRRREMLETTREIADDLCEGEGIELVHVEYAAEGHSNILRIYIDKPGGVTMGDCALISRQLGDLLDVHLDTDEKYRLEVSSPGIDRPLSKESDYKRFMGRTARITTSGPVEGRKKFKGTLKGVSGGNVILQGEEQTFEIPLSIIKRARLVGEIGDNRCL